VRWIKDTAKYASGEILFLGKWGVGGYQWDSCRSKGDPNVYVGTCKLPGVRAMVGKFITVDEAKVKVENVVRFWLSRIED